MLNVRGVTKTYGRLKALDEVSLEFHEGEIHAVLGENGAGKSTLMSVLSGFAIPDGGSVHLDGALIPFGRPFEIKRLGIEMVHQHFMLVPAFSVAENLALYRLERLFGGASITKSSESALDLGKELGWEIDPEAEARDLPVGAQQRVEILKALSGASKVIILDEPTAMLSPAEVDDLFRVLRKLRDAGKTVILIAHKLNEITQVADRVTVLRGGRVVGSAPIGEVSVAKLADWMVGGVPPLLERVSGVIAAGLSARVLSVKGNLGNEAVRGLSFDAAKGEILGIGGVDGNGQIELAEAIAQVRPYSGKLEWMGRPGCPPLGYIPQDRQIDGLALGMSVADNLLIEGHRKRELSLGPFLVPSRIRAWAQRLIERFGILAHGPDTLAGSLSGGNQQKVVVARTLESFPDLLVAVNPTRGLDIQATNYVHSQLLAAKAAGSAILLFSADTDELRELADRMVFMSSGRFVDGLAKTVA